MAQSQSEQHRQSAADETNEKELASRVLQIQSKRFYVDVKQNARGRFIKIAEVGSGGRRSRLIMALPTSEEFKGRLNNFIDTYTKLPPHSSQQPTSSALPDGLLHSDQMVRDNRRYYMDLKENQRGRFLRVSMVTPTRRSQIAIPAQGMIELRNAMTELLAEFGGPEAEALAGVGGITSGQLPESKSMRVENKLFYFDVGSNNRGVFLRISEVRSNFRTAVTIPLRSWSRIRDIFNGFIDELQAGDISQQLDKLHVGSKDDTNVTAAGESVSKTD